MKKNNSFLSSIFIILSMVSCNNKESSIQYIEAYYYTYSFSSDTPSTKEDMVSLYEDKVLSPIIIDGLLEESDKPSVELATITDQSLLIEIESRLKVLEFSPSQREFDIRIYCKIYNKSGSIDELLICGYTADEIIYNTKRVIPDNQVLYEIKSAIGYYNNMGDIILEYSSELQDDLVDRMKVKSVSGRIY